MTMFDLKDKIVVVTGADGLLGKTISSDLENANATVLRADIKYEKGALDRIFLDITSEDSVRQTILEIIKNHGRIDGWVNNAYPRTDDYPKEKFENIKAGSWRENVDMHLNGYFLCSQLVLEEMKKNKKGSLVNMASIYGLVGPDFSVYKDTEMIMPAAYAAIKGGIISLTRYLAAYYGPHQVRVNCISPGGVFNDQPSSFVNRYEEKVPLGRMAKTADISPGVVYLLSEEASYVTGENLMIDGGWTII